MNKDTGARWEITVDGVPRSYRDRKEMAVGGTEYLKSRNPASEVTVHDYEARKPPIVIKTTRQSRVKQAAKRGNERPPPGDRGQVAK
jgi:hypothetical protein